MQPFLRDLSDLDLSDLGSSDLCLFNFFKALALKYASFVFSSFFLKSKFGSKYFFPILSNNSLIPLSLFLLVI